MVSWQFALIHLLISRGVFAFVVTVRTDRLGENRSSGHSKGSSRSQDRRHQSKKKNICSNFAGETDMNSQTFDICHLLSFYFVSRCANFVVFLVI